MAEIRGRRRTIPRLRGIGALPGSWRVKHGIVSPDLARLIYPRVLELASTGQGPAGIARQLSAVYQLSISPGTVRHWIVGDRDPQGGKVRSPFRGEPSPQLSYVIGANIGDGCTLTRNWIVKLEVTDRDFAEAFNSSMAALFSRKAPNKIMISSDSGWTGFRCTSCATPAGRWWNS